MPEAENLPVVRNYDEYTYALFLVVKKLILFGCSKSCRFLVRSGFLGFSFSFFDFSQTYAKSTRPVNVCTAEHPLACNK